MGSTLAAEMKGANNVIELYYHPVSPASQKVRIVLAEKAIEHVTKFVDLPAKENLADWYLKLNQAGVLPTLVADGEPICESSIICEYLEERFPRPALTPGEPAAKARMRLWMKHVDERLHYAAGALIWTLVMRPGMLRKPEAERLALLERIPDRERRKRHSRWVEYGIDSEDLPDAIATFQETIANLDAALARGAWTVSDQFTLADVALAPYFQAIDQFGWSGFTAKASRVAAWFERVRTRPSFKSAILDQYEPGQLDRMKQMGQAEWPKIAARIASR
jgi:glutathione S-transferase